MATSTKIQLNDNKTQQLTGDTLTLSGTTNFGVLEYLNDNHLSSTNPRTIASLEYVTGKTEELNTIKLNKALTQDKTWVGDLTNTAEEVDVVTEWIDILQDTGQKVNQEVQSTMRTGPATDLIHKTFHLVKNIELTLTGTTQVLNTYSEKKFIPYSARAVLTTYTSGTGDTAPSISIGNNSTTYDNVVSDTTLSSPVVNKVYELTLVTGANVDVSSNNLLLNVNTRSNHTTFRIMLILEGLLH